MSILTLEELKDYIGTTGTTKDSLLESAIDAAQQELENYCHRALESSTGTKYYRAEDLIDLPYGSQYVAAGGSAWRGNYSWDQWQGSNVRPINSHRVLWLGRDLLSVDTLTNGDDTTISSTGYWLEPRNSTGSYQYIRLKTSESWTFGTDGEISVAGTWGYSTAADATIKELCKETAKYLIDLKASGVYDVTADPDLGIITVPKGMPQHVKFALDQGGYVRKVGISIR